MKKSLFTLLFAVIFVYGHAQCVLSCSKYTVAQTTYSVFPATGPDVISQFLPNNDDGSTGAIPIGFTFTYNCVAYTDVYICSNGFIQFTPVSWAHGSVVHNTNPIPSSAEPNNMVAFNATDLYPGVGGSVSYTTVGTSPNRMFIVTYSNVPNFSTQSDLNTGQIVLYETSNEIEIHTTEAHGDSNQSGNGSQGIENLNGSDGVPVPGRSASSGWFPGTNTAYRFINIYVPTPPTSVTGTASSCEGIVNMYSVSTMPGATSYTWSLPAFWNGNTSGSIVTATAGMSGVLTASATYSCGTSSAATLMVNVFPSPVVAVSSATPAIFCSGVTTTITTTGAANYTLQPGNFVGTPPFTDTPMVTTAYTVTGVDANGCYSKNLATYTVAVKPTPTLSVNGGSVCIGKTFTFMPTGADTYSYSTIFSQTTPTLVGVNTYSVWGFNNNGCKSQTVAVTVTAAPLPTITATAARSTICSKESTILTPSGGVTYQWIQHTSTTTLSVKPIGNTTYSLTGTDANGCVSSGTIQVKVIPCTGIDNQSADNQGFMIYPNPAHDALNVKIEFAGTLSIFDALGREVYSTNVEAGHHQIRVDELPAGKYLINAGSPQFKKHLVFIKN